MAQLDKVFIPTARDYSRAMDIPQQIESLREQFAGLGVHDPHSAVMLWMGKHNRHTGVVMSSPQEILEFMQMERGSPPAPATPEEELAAAPATPAEPAAPARKGRPASTAKDTSELDAANDRWRKAIVDRKRIVAEWDAYVEHCRAAFQELKRKA